jgi:C-terminal processing protease CtpA/Prc
VWRYITRPGLELPGFEKRGYTAPPDEAFTGPLVVLVDVLSGSSSEEFAGALQSQGRATIVGERTAGSVLVMDLKPLPDGGTLAYPLAQTQTADGTVLEGRGVIPDIAVSLNHESLLQGVDPQLEAALQALQEAALGE